MISDRHFDKPWGSERIMERGPNYCVKALTVAPLHRLSLQKHAYRDEYWTCVGGEGAYQIGHVSYTVRPGSTQRIPRGQTHRITNTSDTHPLTVIEVAYGEHIDAADIHRVEDDYGRT